MTVPRDFVALQHPWTRSGRVQWTITSTLGVLMGFDVSFHPIDVAMIQERLVPYVRGQGGIDDLVADAVRIARVRYRANAWGLGVWELNKTAIDRPQSPIPATFDSDLHIWGRPFFITGETPEEVSEGIDLYTAATFDTTDEIAQEMLRRLDPALVGQVTPSQGATLPEDEKLARGIRWKMDLFREAYAALKRGEQVTGPEGDDLDPEELFAGDFALAVVDFMAYLRPGWMARGYVWPTCLLGEADLDQELLGPATEMFGPFADEVPAVGENLDGAITSNYMVGGYAAPDRVAPLIAYMEQHRAAILRANEDCQVELRKIHEAMHDARRRGMGFAEATEIYSGIMGIMN